MRTRIKNLLLLSLVFVFSVVSLCGIIFANKAVTKAEALQSKGVINVYLIGGQSNAVGYGKDTDGVLVGQDARFSTGFDNVIYYGAQERVGSSVNEQFQNVKIGLGRTESDAGAEIGIASALGDTDTMNAVIKCAWGATHIYPDTQYDISKSQGTWTSPSYIEEYSVDTSENPKIGRMYSWFVETVTKGIELLEKQGYTPVIKGMWWMQGEAEMFTEEMSSQYDELLTALIKDVREDVSKITRSNYNEMPFVLGLPIWNTSVSGAPAYETAVRTNMQSVANNQEIINVASVDCTGLVQHDMWHYDATSQKWLGEQFISSLETLTEGENDSFKENISLTNGASIRFNEPNGIRFMAKIAGYNVENGYRYGMLIIPTDYLETYKTQLESANYDYIKAFTDNNVTIANMYCNVLSADADNDNIVEDYIQGSLTNIKYKNLNREFTGIGYIYDQTENKYLYTSASVSRSVTYVASANILKYQETDDVYVDLLNYVNGGINQKNGVSEENGYAQAELGLSVTESLTLEYGGEIQTKQITVTQTPAMGYAVKFISNNVDVATVDANGVVTPISVGETTITVKCLNIEKTVEITVSVPEIDGVKIDGERDDKYGNFTDTVLLDNGRWYSISAVKTENGVFVYSQALFNTSSVESSWGNSTDLEFKLNATAEQNYVALGDQAYGVTQYFVNVVEQDGKYLHTVEFFADKSIIYGWNDNENVQLNYAWKSPNENAIMLSSMMDYRYMDWNTAWHSYHTLGGLSTYYAEMPDNLYIGENGLTPLTGSADIIIDGDLSEYDEMMRTANNANTTAGLWAKIIDSDLYMAVTITHNQWATYTSSLNSWASNDNIEMRLNGNSGDENRVVIMFNENGDMLYPSYFDYAVSKTVEVNGKLLTTAEFYAKDVEVLRFLYMLAGSNFGWIGGLVFDSGVAYVSQDGIVATRPTTLTNGVTLDGNFNETLWTESIKANSISTTANGANVKIMARKLDTGVLIGSTIDHNTAPNVSTDGSNLWYTYLNVEFRFNNGEAHFATVRNDRTTYAYSYATTTTNATGSTHTYTSNIEMFIRYEDIGVKATDRLNVAIGGWYETGFAWLYGGYDVNPTHVITEDGIFDKNNVQDDVLKILTIGNSFSDDTMEYIGKIAQSMNVSVVLGNLYIGGCDIDTHLNNLNNNLGAYDYRTYQNGGWVTTSSYKMRDAIISENWDYISFQQASGKSGVESTYANLNSLVESVKSIANKNAKCVWNMTWAYQSDSTHGDFPTYNSDQTTMYNAIINAVQSQIVTNDNFAIISPTGTAIQNARATSLGDTLTRDGYHLELTYGRYIAGLTFFHAITGIDISNIEFAPEGIDDTVKAICIEVAINAVKTPYSVTSINK